MTLRKFAAIKLKVPNSGTDWCDDMSELKSCPFCVGELGE